MRQLQVYLLDAHDLETLKKRVFQLTLPDGQIVSIGYEGSATDGTPAYRCRFCERNWPTAQGQLVHEARSHKAAFQKAKP